MYGNATAAAETNYKNQAASQINSGQLKQPLISDAVLRELSILLEKAQSVANRQNNLRERIFGPAPEAPNAKTQDMPSPTGLLHQMNYNLQALQTTMDIITQNCVDLERLA